jgi:hypothetical protein
MLRRRLLVLTTATAVAASALLAAGCGGGHSVGVAGVTASTIAGTTAPATTPQTGVLAYSHCMRAHGVPGFPDPDGSGDIPKLQVVNARNSNPSRFDSANVACRGLLPVGGPHQEPTITPAEQADYLKAAQCMRSHGFPDFPDPTFPNNNVRVNVPSSINQDSTRFKSAATICTKLIPAGLPYTKPPGS